LAFCKANAALPREVLEGSTLSTLVQMASAGIGVTLIPEMALGVETRATPVCVSHFRKPEPSRTIGMIWRKTNPLGDQLRGIADIARRSATALREAPPTA
jgi:LysR family hydrogen peroxide-inducible transcriptional activator